VDGGADDPAGQQKVHISHGMAMHGEPKYPVDAGAPDYVNPTAPKGGGAKFGAPGTSTFDSLHPFIIKGVPAAGISTLWETPVLARARRGLHGLWHMRRDDRMA